MSSKKPSPTPVRKTTRPPAPRTALPGAANPRLQIVARWQRSKHYGWDSR